MAVADAGPGGHLRDAPAQQRAAGPAATGRRGESSGGGSSRGGSRLRLREFTLQHHHVQSAEPHAILAPAPPAFAPSAAIQATARPEPPAAAVARQEDSQPYASTQAAAQHITPKVASPPAGATPPSADRRRTCKACFLKGHFAKKCPNAAAAAGRGSDSPSPPKQGPSLQQESGTSWLRPPPPSIPGAAKKQIAKEKGGGKSASAAGNGSTICECGKSVKRGSLTSHLETELHKQCAF